MRPTGLTNPCARCNSLMPFDPQARNQLCNCCNRMLALGGSFYVPNNIGQQPGNNVPNDIYPTSPYQSTSTQGYRVSMSSGPSQPSMTPQTSQSTPGPLSIQTSTAPQGLKRKHGTSFDQQYSNKRPYQDAFAPHTPSLLRQNLSSSAIGERETGFADEGSGDEEGEEEFEDAPESQERDAQGETRDQYGESEADAEGKDEEVEEVGKAQSGEVGDQMQDEGEQEDAEIDDDLFTSAFGQNAGKRSGHDEEEEEDSDADCADNNNDTPKKPNTTTTATLAFDRTTLITSLQSSATIAPTKKPTKPKPKSHPPTGAQEVPKATIPRDLAHNLRKQHTFHTSSLEFLPRLPLAEHRYWIGVLKAGSKPRTTQSEKNFTWMKGNRLTTVETVWHAYCNAAAEDDVVLLLGFERPGWGVRCEELNYFADNKIVFRAVKETHKDAEGRGLCEELIKEVVDIDGGEEGRKEKGKEKGKEKVKGKVREVIEIDDD